MNQNVTIVAGKYPSSGDGIQQYSIATIQDLNIASPVVLSDMLISHHMLNRIVMQRYVFFQHAP